MKFEQAVNEQLCRLLDELKKIRQLNETWEHRETDGIVFITIPENASVASQSRSFSVGTTKIDFLSGVITNPDGSTEELEIKLSRYGQKWLHSLSMDANQDIVVRIGGLKGRAITASFSTQIPYLNYNTLEVDCTVVTGIQIFACTNPSAVIGQFKQTTVNILEQDSINGDGTELQTWDAVVNLKNNLNRIRNQIITITGEAWGTVSHSIATVWAKFNATTGHKHTGAADDAPTLTDASIAAGAAIALSKLAALTEGRVVFPNSSGVMIGGASLFWDAINNRLGIGGATSPSSILHLKGNINNWLRIENTGTSGRTWEVNGLITGVGNTGFEIRDVTAGVSRLVIDADGYIGMGSTTPTDLLDVNGNIKCTTLNSQTISAMTQSVVTGSRVLGTVYQNNSGKPMYVAVVTSATGINTGIQALTDSSNPPTTVVWNTQMNQNAAAGTANHGCFFVVLPGNYYKVNGNGTSPGLVYWTEWT